MKLKFIYIFAILLLLCGCQNISDKKIDDITKYLASDIDPVNTYRSGYSYYLPKALSVKEYRLYNDIIESSDNTFYLYVDMVSFHNKVISEYEVNPNAWYSQKFNFDKKFGYIEINLQKNDQYLIEIMFNYAKIEVMVDYDEINLALSYAVSILRSIEYNENVITNMLGDNKIDYREEVYNIFDTTSSDSNYLKYAEDNSYIEEDTEIKDTDLIN